MEKLIIPKNCVVEGSISRLTHDGDIQLENGMIPPHLTSESGSIRIVQIPSGTSCDAIVASAGEVDIQGASISVDQIVAQSLTAQFNEIESQSVQTTGGTTYVNGEKVTLGQLSGDAVVIEGESVKIGMLRASGTVQITAKNIHIEEMECTEATVAGQFEASKVIASDGFFITSGHVAIKNLDAPSFSSDEGVGGIVMVATCEKVITQGVRGFLRPAELGLFSKGGTTMDLSEILGSGSTPLPTAAAVHETETSTGSSPAEEPAASVADAAANEPAGPSHDVPPIDEPVAVHEPDSPSVTELEPVTELVEEIVEEEGEEVVEEAFAQEAQQDEEALSIEANEEDGPDPVAAGMEIDIQQLSMRTTVVVDDEALQDDDGEMKTIQLAPELLAEALHNEAEKAKNNADDLLEPGPDEVVLPDALESMISDTELDSDADSAENLDDSAELPEIEGFDDYHSTGEIFGDSASLDEPLEADDAAPSLDIPNQDENLWEDQENPSEDIQVEALDDDIEVEELSEDDLYSVDEDDFSETDDTPEENSFQNPEAKLRHSLTDSLNQIRDYFPDENYPKFIYQIQNYVNEGRFSILAKPRNRDAVLSSFEKLNHPDISKLSDQFYNTLAQYFEAQED